MAIAKKYHYKHKNTLRDVRSPLQRLRDSLLEKSIQPIVFGLCALAVIFFDEISYAADFIFLLCLLYFWWLKSRGHTLPAKMPMSASQLGIKDENNDGPGRGKRSEGIMFVGNAKDTNGEIWYTNNDIKTHVLYLGTTGSGKTVGLTSMVTNALCWGSGFVFVDGKADTGLWSSMSALARRFGRDDDLLVLNYMTGNSDAGAPSNTLNPFSGGSASYLTNLMVTLMPDAGGDNAMWKERAVSLIGSLMPAMTWKRDHQEIPLNINTIRQMLNFPDVIRLSRDPDVPKKITMGIKGYLDTLPGYVDDVFDDDGNEKPMPPDAPMVDTSTVRQQHGYLSMQFTRSLQSLADDYGYVFETEAADIDMTDVVLNRRMLVVLIPALEKSSDEAANLGKIVAATIKGMMGSTLGADVEGDVESTIENKVSESSTPFICIFDEVGYYAAQGMAVMAAQARSLGFCLVYAAQDLPALEKRVKEEARSITANCNLKIFGKLEDPTQTKEFFEKTVGDVLVAEVSGFQANTGGLSTSFVGKQDASMQSRARASYDGLRAFKEGDAVVTFGEMLEEISFFYSNPGNAKSMRIQKMLEPPKPDESKLRQKKAINSFIDNYRTRGWSAASSATAIETEDKIQDMVDGFSVAQKSDYTPIQNGAMAVAKIGMGFMDDYKKPEPVKASAPASTAASISTPITVSAPTNETSADTGMSWMDLMGDDDDDAPSTNTVSAAPSVSLEEEQEDSGSSWGDFMSDANDETTIPEADNITAPAALAVSVEDTVSPAETNEPDSEASSWGDFMSDADDVVNEPQQETTSQLSDDMDSTDFMSDVIEGVGEPSVDARPSFTVTADDTADLETSAPAPAFEITDTIDEADDALSWDSFVTNTVEDDIPDSEDITTVIAENASDIPVSSMMDEVPQNDAINSINNTSAVAQDIPVSSQVMTLPEGLSPDVEDILKSAANTVQSGLFEEGDAVQDIPTDTDDK